MKVGAHTEVGDVAIARSGKVVGLEWHCGTKSAAAGLMASLTQVLLNAQGNNVENFVVPTRAPE